MSNVFKRLLEEATPRRGYSFGDEKPENRKPGFKSLVMGDRFYTNHDPFFNRVPVDTIPEYLKLLKAKAAFHTEAYKYHKAAREAIPKQGDNKTDRLRYLHETYMFNHKGAHDAAKSDIAYWAKELKERKSKGKDLRLPIGMVR